MIKIKCFVHMCLFLFLTWANTLTPSLATMQTNHKQIKKQAKKSNVREHNDINVIMKDRWSLLSIIKP